MHNKMAVKNVLPKIEAKRLSAGDSVEEKMLPFTPSVMLARTSMIGSMLDKNVPKKALSPTKKIIISYKKFCI